jgi:hypothetical protein
MHAALTPYCAGFVPTGDLRADAVALLISAVARS